MSILVKTVSGIWDMVTSLNHLLKKILQAQFSNEGLGQLRLLEPEEERLPSIFHVSHVCFAGKTFVPLHSDKASRN